MHEPVEGVCSELKKIEDRVAIGEFRSQWHVENAKLLVWSLLAMVCTNQ
jgi:hypothetical protein